MKKYSLKDKGKIIYDLKKGKFGEYRTVFDYSLKLPKNEELTKEECALSSKFISYTIFVKDIVGNSSNFWDCISNFDIAYNKKEVEKHFNNKIKDIEEELELWKQFKEMQLKKADEYFTEFKEIKKSTNYFNY